VNDSAARMNNYISSDADWITFEATVSTSPDQIAIAPGYLQKEWQANGRHYFHYKMDSKILNFYSFLSANYQVHKDKWKDVNIEIYYQKGHEYNLDRMVKSVKNSLDYFTQNFSPYQHRQVRIIEFPRYASFAQSFPNTIPYSESIGFIAKVDTENEKDIDYPFYVTAHEVAHQWWAHQVIGGNVQGSTVMSETMSQYSALMVMEKEYGRNQMKRFLKYELDQYLRGRSSESEKELPLYRVENQGYIHYNKGSLVMYALRDYIGEATLNQALAAYIRKMAFQEPPYTNSLEFLSYIGQATPDSLQYLIKDMFKEITLYENRITSASYTTAGNGQYKVKLQLNAKKFIADSLGYEKEQALHDWIEIGVFAPETGKQPVKPLYMGKHLVKAGNNTIEILVKQKPEKAGIDPYFKLVDRNPEDNIMRISGE
jgi:aminopeptidase N